MDHAQDVLQVGGEGIPPPAGTPLVLHVFPPPGFSDLEEFLYDPFPNNVAGDFAAACIFVIEHGHTIVVNNCLNPALFQRLFLGAMLQYLSLVLRSILSRGQALLQAAANAASHAASTTVIAVTRSFLECYCNKENGGNSVAGATFGLRSIGGAPLWLDPDGIAHSFIMPWDSFLSCSARTGHSQAYWESLHIYGTPPTLLGPSIIMGGPSSHNMKGVPVSC
jgi:hypothetical protein